MAVGPVDVDDDELELDEDVGDADVLAGPVDEDDDSREDDEDDDDDDEDDASDDDDDDEELDSTLELLDNRLVVVLERLDEEL